jgi:hypothetical protein
MQSLHIIYPYCCRSLPVLFVEKVYVSLLLDVPETLLRKLKHVLVVAEAYMYLLLKKFTCLYSLLQKPHCRSLNVLVAEAYMSAVAEAYMSFAVAKTYMSFCWHMPRCCRSLCVLEKHKLLLPCCCKSLYVICCGQKSLISSSPLG